MVRERQWIKNDRKGLDGNKSVNDKSDAITIKKTIRNLKSKKKKNYNNDTIDSGKRGNDETVENNRKTLQ